MQVEDLKRIYGEDVKVIQVHENIKSIDRIIELMREYPVNDIVVVLPIELIQQLIERGIRPLRAKMERVIRDDGTCEFKHMYFERIKNVKIETERL